MIKEEIADILYSEGYLTFAILAAKVNYTLADDGHTAWVEPMTNTIALSSTLLRHQVSSVVRHELMHVVLKHWQRREVGDYDARRFYTACDYELSNYYSAEDVAVSRELGGLNVVDTPEFAEKTAEEIYELLPEDEYRDGDGYAAVLHLDGIPEDTLAKILAELQQIEEKKKAAIEQASFVSEMRKLSIPAPVSVASNLLSDLRTEMRRALGVDRVKSWARPPRQQTGILKKGYKHRRIPVPTLAVYVDRSGSMTPEKTAIAEGVVESINSRRYCLEKWYFSDSVFRENDYGGGGTNYAAVVEHIDQNHFTHVVVITDNDSDGGSNVAELDTLWLVSVDGQPTIADRFSADIRTIVL